MAELGAPDDSCPICGVISGKYPTNKLYEDEVFIATLDIRPAQRGHVLIMPKKHYPFMQLIPQQDFSAIFGKLGVLTSKLKAAMATEAVTVFIAAGGAAGQQVSHFLLHLVPHDHGKEKNFFLTQKEVAKSEAAPIIAEVTERVQKMLKPQGGSSVDDRKKKIVALLNENPQLQELLLTDLEKFKELTVSREDLNALFEGVDLAKLADALRSAGSPQNKPSTDATPKDDQEPEEGLEALSQKEPDDDVDLDAVSKYFG
ncbi:MAG: HIT family protein [Candidatus Woesearchaeota archaeon]|nr:MAG: HIT family protein [Candidatus Woesearchaeota archaeon]